MFSTATTRAVSGPLRGSACGRATMVDTWPASPGTGTSTGPIRGEPSRVCLRARGVMCGQCVPCAADVRVDKGRCEARQLVQQPVLAALRDVVPLGDGEVRGDDDRALGAELV